MTNLERAMALMVDAHCRYCHNSGPDAHPAMKCNGDIEDLGEEIVKALDEAEARGAARERAAIAQRCYDYDSGKCAGHDDDPCCHKRTAAAIAAWIEDRGQ